MLRTGRWAAVVSMPLKTDRKIAALSVHAQLSAYEKLPISRFVVLQELAPDMLTAVDAADDRIDDPRGAIDDIQRRMKALLDDLARCELRRILVGDPAGVDRIHVDAVVAVIGSGRSRHHVERGLGHVGVR